MNRFFSTLTVAAVAVAVGTLAPAAHQAAPAAAATAPPSPPPVTIAPSTAPSGPAPSTPAPASVIPIAPGAHAPGQTPPPDDNRKGLDGVWEVAVQSNDGDTTYVHFKLTQKGSILTGTFLDNVHNNKKYPLAGSIDGKTIHLVVTKDDGTTITFTGTVDGTTDMVGMMQQGPQTVAFTAAYRPKYKFIDTISPVPGGLGGGTGGPP